MKKEKKVRRARGYRTTRVCTMMFFIQCLPGLRRRCRATQELRDEHCSGERTRAPEKTVRHGTEVAPAPLPVLVSDRSVRVDQGRNRQCGLLAAFRRRRARERC